MTALRRTGSPIFVQDICLRWILLK
jgi:hypothetical protein